ncbi:uncharacterized protein LOC124299344 isoform X4 [Neodiprion virginianus]|uniref:uncharacterized protein LOC124299344 isoform X4 n=1 Tax=Neodiprion virginianus TaxID=2961670 RepID=UPI001EE74712|nr:uncharacterized protein LOC124299344 isoform X4 [Neodiprion virginianus]
MRTEDTKSDHTSGLVCYLNGCNEGKFETENKIKNCRKTTCSFNDSCPEVSSSMWGGSSSFSYDEIFNLDIFVGKTKTVLNLTITNITFYKLHIGLRYISMKPPTNDRICQTVDLRNDTSSKTLSWYSLIHHGFDAILQLLLEGKSTSYFKKYALKAPRRRAYDADETPQYDDIFTYVDVSVSDKVFLNMKPLPLVFNVSMYNVSFCKFSNHNCKLDKPEHVKGQLTWEQSLFPQENSKYYFKVTPISKHGGKVLEWTKSAHFVMKSSLWTATYIVTTVVFLLIGMFFVLRRVYFYYRNKKLPNIRSRKPRCLLIYDGTHNDHIDVMIKLAEYLISCDIDAIIDVLHAMKDDFNLHSPTQWCDEALHMSNCVIVAQSPPRDNSVRVTRTIYRFLYDHARRLIEEDYHQNRRRYFFIEFQYCQQTDIPVEAASFKRFKMPTDLDKLVDEVHNADYSTVYTDHNARDFINSINLATRSIINQTREKPTSFENIPSCLSKNNPRSEVDSTTIAGNKSTTFMNGKRRDFGDRSYATLLSSLDLLEANEKFNEVHVSHKNVFMECE